MLLSRHSLHESSYSLRLEIDGALIFFLSLFVDVERRQIHTKVLHFMLLRNILFVSREEPPQESGLV